ncbi:MAG: Phospho-N-acetylmuramoyl-pentapeptide-transferase (EC [uncultured Campylobacterales bacterium]|uniref:Phospho-N-acetylmuramoyl-pentapeptide-transferase n=1 Tax=uncultured Campylobacterales bacterium TaxID=352960 RepID=A0A6S6SLL4_9BACT|nr:MAG: Phospho-N-acetylmuramoyl-pentapeptide-transferase (EC [uncultured Campylobacterales bacterium]
MLYSIYNIFDINLLQYITSRASFAFLFAFFITMFLMPKFIRWAKRKNASQPIFHLAPESHKTKSSTPTMGGVVFLSSCIISTLICVKLNNIYVIGALLVLIIFGAIGLKDDLAKILGKSNTSGLKPRVKMLLQILGAGVVALLLLFVANFNTEFYVPFYKYPLFDMGFFSLLFWILVIVSTSNAVNLTDGLDGLATVPSIFAILSFSIFIYVGGHALLSEYFLLPRTVELGEVAIVCSAMIGALIGFLWHNCHPAEVFMGDTGSLSLGAFLGYLAVISKNEILLILIGSIFVIETLSVILQVGSYKTRKKRVFAMAPLHHHFEMIGWAENKIIVRFWIVALISNLIAIATIKFR